MSHQKQQVFHKIVQKIAELAEVDFAEVEESRPLKDLGIDSLMAIELIVFIERMLKRPFPEDKMGAIKTCADVFREVEGLMAAEAA